MSTQIGPEKSNRNRRWRMLLMALPLLGMLCLASTLFGQRQSEPEESILLPVSLHSVLEADYRSNPNPRLVSGVRLDLIWDVIFDREPGATDLEARKAALLNSLQTPVPLATSPACQDTHIIYASQDTWLDSGSPTATHGRDAVEEDGG